MAKKKTQRGDIPKMTTLTAAQQEAMMQRWKLRHDLRQAYQDIVDMLVVCCIDDFSIPAFHATGHEAIFQIQPVDDFTRRLKANGFSIDEIETRLKNGEVAASWMTPEEVAALLENIAAMEDYFISHDPGTFAEILEAYKRIGEFVREEFIQQYGYAPEQSPIPGVRIEGKEDELPKLKPTDLHQPPLF